MQIGIYRLWQKSFRILIVTILWIHCFVYFVGFILDLERGSNGYVGLQYGKDGEIFL